MDVSIQNYLNQIKFFWLNKFEKIKIKDVFNLRLNKRKGWKTFEIWECVINDKKIKGRN